MQSGGSQYAVSSEITFCGTVTGAQQLTGIPSGTDQPQLQQQLNLGDPTMTAAEAASPISSRPPATAVGYHEESLPDEDALAAADEADRGGVSGGNRWPRQETLALLKIRSEMDVAFRDATLKGPLWEEVSRKLGEAGYIRSAKKCKEKFENVHKYYKRTKEGRAGRQDGKSYRFFSQLEALHSNLSGAPLMSVTTTTTAVPPRVTNTAIAITSAAPVSIAMGNNNPMLAASVRNPASIPATAPHTPNVGSVSPVFAPDLSAGMTHLAVSGSTTAATPAAVGISFSSNGSSSSSGSEDDIDDDDDDDDDEFAVDDDDDEADLKGEPSNTDPSHHRKRKRGSFTGGSSSGGRMMDFFEGLMKQVMQKQEAMQQRFLDVIEKREHDRMIREEAWRRQEMTRLSREHELMAQERAISASRDAAIVSFLQKITGQNIQLPTPAVTQPAAAPPSASSVPPPPPPPPQQQQQQKHLQYQVPRQQQQQQQFHHHHPKSPNALQTVPLASQVVMAIPEQQVPPQKVSGVGSFDHASSRWPKAEVLALIKLRSALEARYQEAGPKGPLWEEISLGMLRMGYKRSAKRCKEKWENINKYFKKVKESNKKRPEDAKTCPYFHQLDALYQNKILGASSSSSSFANQIKPEQNMLADSIPTTTNPDRSTAPAIMPNQRATEVNVDPEHKSDEEAGNGSTFPGSLFGEGAQKKTL